MSDPLNLPEIESKCHLCNGKAGGCKQGKKKTALPVMAVG